MSESRPSHPVWAEAPLYVRAHDFSRWLMERQTAWSPQAMEQLGAALARNARTLLCAVSLALTFPTERPRRLIEADRSVVRLRVLLRLARELGLLSPGATRYAMGELREIGRMLGGWKRRLGRRRRRRPPGDGPEGPRTG